MRSIGRLVLTLALAAASASSAQAACPWPAWDAFRAAYVQADGRVIDRSQPEQPTVSEAAAYTAFLALVADDRPTFDSIVRWVRDNLAAGDLATRLPAWRWGRRGAGDWGVLDTNSATDADLWLAYALLEGGRRWHDPALIVAARHVAERILSDEVIYPDGREPVLLPGPIGFQSDDGHIRVNPSYAPPFVVQRLSALDPRYRPLLDAQDRLWAATVRRGFVPDWAEYVVGEGYRSLSDDLGRGSYGAIRVYLWTALMPDGRSRRQALERLRPFAATLGSGPLPEWFDPRSGATGGQAGRAHLAALLPFLKIVDRPRYTQVLRALHTGTLVAGDGRRYYADVLTLFAMGAEEGRYTIAGDGGLRPGSVTCRH